MKPDYWIPIAIQSLRLFSLMAIPPQWLQLVLQTCQIRVERAISQGARKYKHSHRTAMATNPVHGCESQN
jgi:hypothetical protein